MKTSTLATSAAAIGLVAIGAGLAGASNPIIGTLTAVMFGMGVASAYGRMDDDTQINAGQVKRAAAMTAAMIAVFAAAVVALRTYVGAGAPSTGSWLIPDVGTGILFHIACWVIFEKAETAEERDERIARLNREDDEAMARPIINGKALAIRTAALAAIFAATMSLPEIVRAFGLQPIFETPKGAAIGAAHGYHLIGWSILMVASYAIFARTTVPTGFDGGALIARLDAWANRQIGGRSQAILGLALGAIAMTAIVYLAIVVAMTPGAPDPSSNPLLSQAVWAAVLVVLSVLLGEARPTRTEPATSA